MPLVATLEGLAADPRDLCQPHGRPAAFCTLCARGGRASRPAQGLASAPLAPPVPPAPPAPRPMTTHEKWTIGLGVAGLVLSLATTLALLSRTRR